MTRHLTLPQKRQLLGYLTERDGGFRCFYCKKELDQKTAVFEHLNNRRLDNRPDNLVLACQSCNIKKITEEPMLNLAYAKLEQNEDRIFVGEKNLRKLNLAGSSDTSEISKEIDINTTNYDITQQYITEVIETDGSIEFEDALHSSVYLCKDKTGHGSQQSVRNYIKTLTSSVAPFQIIRDSNKKKIIVKRTDRIDLTRNQVPASRP